MRIRRLVLILVIASMVTANVLFVQATVRANEGYTVISTWGKQGRGPGAFDGPFDVAVDAEGFVYVTDAGNRRVQKFTPDGTFVHQWGNQRSASAVFRKPTGIAVGPDHTIFVADYMMDTIAVFTDDGTLLTRWGRSGHGPGELDSPAGVAVSADGTVYVADEYNFRIQKFTSEGRFLLAWGKKGKVNVVISALNFLLPEDREGELYYPARVAVGPDRLIYVADSYNNRVQVFTPQGKFVRKWGGLGIWSGRFRVSSGIAFDRHGHVLVADFYNNRVQVFEPDGRYVTQFGKAGSKPGQFDGPTGLASSPTGDIYVADFHNHRIQRLRWTTKYQR
ncbi:MAG: 6-bladed beta-propeller [Nitrospirae bacterium]|nr:MAG: 6-bladed beta-propeller [Nitrospirota bacterium]